MKLPETMRVIECRGFGGPEVLHVTQKPLPDPMPGEVLIKVAAAGLNRADLLQRQGKYPPPEGATDILGMEVSGEIAALGAGVTKWKTSDKVCALLASGGYAEYATAPEGQCFPVSRGFSPAEAAALPEALVTVWANLFEAGGLQAGKTALVHGGTSGVGTMAIQMAKFLGAKIFVTAGSAEKCTACRTLGADLAINYNEEDFVAAVQRATNGNGVDTVLDMVGGDYFPRNLETLAPGGRHVSIATQRGKLVAFDMRLVMQKGLTITGSTLRGRLPEEKARLCRAVQEKFAPALAAGKVKPLIYNSFPLEKANDAHKMMESGAHIGKIVLEVAR